MRLDCILTACNENPLYQDFIPIFVRTWKKLYPQVDVRIVYIAESIPERFLPYAEHLILFKPIPGVSTSFTSQYIRLLYPAVMNYNNGIMITDIDMLPMNRTYYTKNIEGLEDDKFISLRGGRGKEIYICYNTALSSTWASIFEIKTLEDIIKRLTSVCSSIRYTGTHGGIGWSTDQVQLYNAIMRWKEKSSNFIALTDCKTGFKRLERLGYSSNLDESIRSGQYSDHHCPRPYSLNMELNECVYNAL